MAERPLRVCFVCMGNICRSPLAENVFRHKARERGIDHHFQIDSAGTGGWHAGEPPDARMRQVASARGIRMSGCARQVTREDFRSFDLLICMDEENRDVLLNMGAPLDKVKLLLECDPKAECREVPDPYYGGLDGFENVFDLVDSACEALLDQILSEHAGRLRP